MDVRKVDYEYIKMTEDDAGKAVVFILPPYSSPQCR